jgi:hypothetical protein
MLRQHSPDQRVVAISAGATLGCLSGSFGEFEPSLRHHKSAHSIRLVARMDRRIERGGGQAPVTVHLAHAVHRVPPTCFRLLTSNQELALRSLQTGNTGSQNKPESAETPLGNLKFAELKAAAVKLRPTKRRARRCPRINCLIRVTMRADRGLPIIVNSLKVRPLRECAEILSAPCLCRVPAMLGAKMRVR